MDLRWHPPSLLWFIIIFSACFLFVFNILEIRNFSITTTFQSPRAKTVILAPDMNMKGYLVKTPGCTIPDIPPMNPSIAKFIFVEDEVVCNNGTPPLIASNLTSIYILKSSLGAYNINDTDYLSCCYTEFHRKTPGKNEGDKSIKYDKKCNPFKDSALISDEFIRVTCKYNNSKIYKDFFDFVPLKKEQNKTNVTNKLNVLMIGIDAVSRLNFYRQMPKTVKLLEELNMVQMLGYNKVGDNTFPNLMPVLSGHTEEELKKICWPDQDAFFDDCPFIWKKFSDVNYVTAFAEDAAWMGLFYYTRRGFNKKQTTDYFWDQFNIISEKEIGNNHRLNCDQCVGSRYVYKVLLDYITKFTTTMHNNNIRYFGCFWGSSLSHDFLNKPKLGDEDYFQTIKAIQTQGILNNTVLIVMSDHGIRWGDIRSTYQGRMEERLPFLFIRLPEWYTNEHNYLYDNLRTNTRRLTTPFDLHETLVDLVNADQLTNEFISERGNNLTELSKRGISLFNKLNISRTCDDAAIPSHFCTCQSTKIISPSDKVVIEAANYTVNEHINEQLIGYADCSVLVLDKILSASIQIVDNKEVLQSHYSQDYTITFQTQPGGGLFEATIRKYINPNDYYFNVTGTVSRINLYGKQSLCITDFHLKLFCYCKNYIPDD